MTRSTNLGRHRFDRCAATKRGTDARRTCWPTSEFGRTSRSTPSDLSVAPSTWCRFCVVCSRKRPSSSASMPPRQFIIVSYPLGRVPLDFKPVDRANAPVPDRWVTQSRTRSSSPPDAFRRLMSAKPGIADLIFNAFDRPASLLRTMTARAIRHRLAVARPRPSRCTPSPRGSSRARVDRPGRPTTTSTCSSPASACARSHAGGRHPRRRSCAAPPERASSPSTSGSRSIPARHRVRPGRRRQRSRRSRRRGVRGRPRDSLTVSLDSHRGRRQAGSASDRDYADSRTASRARISLTRPPSRPDASAPV